MDIFPETFYKKKMPKRRSHKELILKKIFSLNQLIYNKEFDISKVSNLCFDKLRNAKKVCIVGNGRVEKNISHLIEKFDVVIRFNDYTNATYDKLVGTKTDIHFLSLNNGNKEGNQDNWLKECDCRIIMEIHREKIYENLSDTFKEKTISPSSDYINSIKKIGEITRGFYALGICLQVKESVNKDMKIYIIGFGGKGHHLEKYVHISHNHKEEMTIINHLKDQKSIIDLQDCEKKTEATSGEIRELKAIFIKLRDDEGAKESALLNNYWRIIEQNDILARFITFNNGDLELAKEQTLLYIEWHLQESQEEMRRESHDKAYLFVPKVDPSVLGL